MANFLENYRKQLDGLSLPVRIELAEYFGMRISPRSRMRWSLTDQLGLLGLCQADVVLALLRLGRLPEAEIVVGRPIRRVPRSLRTGIRPVLKDASSRTGDERKVVWVAENPRSPSTSAWHRWQIVRVGRTVAQLLARGFRRNDLRLATAYGWIRLEDEQ